MLTVEAQKALAPLCDRSSQLKAVTKRVFVIDKNGVVAGDLRPAADTGPDAVKRTDLYR
jgi:hypothetical protein